MTTNEQQYYDDHVREEALREEQQVEDDILHHMNAITKEVIKAFETLDHSDGDDQSYYEDHSHHAPQMSPPSSEDDLEENTDTDDEIEEVLRVVSTNTDLIHYLRKQCLRKRKSINEILDIISQNTNLIACLHKQRDPIARLRARIARMNVTIIKLESTHKDDSHDFHNNDNVSSCITPEDDKATVLVDIDNDMSFILKPTADPHLTADFLYHPKIRSELEIQLGKIKKWATSGKELWMYFDSGASRSVISTTSPIRPRLQNIVPTYGSCSIGNGTPLQYIEKG
jgi:hypothetical protein